MVSAVCALEENSLPGARNNFPKVNTTTTIITTTKPKEEIIEQMEQISADEITEMKAGLTPLSLLFMDKINVSDNKRMSVKKKN